MPLFVYRVGVAAAYVGKRYLFSTIIVSEEPAASAFEEVLTVLQAGDCMKHCLGNGIGTHYLNSFNSSQLFAQRLFPQVKILASAVPFPGLLDPHLDATSPEAAVRLQRVGASGSIGRSAVPLLDARAWTDNPHRRHYDVAKLQADVDLNGIGIEPLSPVIRGRQMHHAIWHRKSFTWEQVTHYRVAQNPIRVWQRWRTFNHARYDARDRGWAAPEHKFP